jgi:hypothetical protein
MQRKCITESWKTSNKEFWHSQYLYAFSPFVLKCLYFLCDVRIVRDLTPSERIEALLQAPGTYLQAGAAMPAMTRKRCLLAGKTDPCCPWPLVYPEFGAPGSRLDRPGRIFWCRL